MLQELSMNGHKNIPHYYCSNLTSKIILMIGNHLTMYDHLYSLNVLTVRDD